mmetsp:Transcript_128851/g.412586  ORF Transcript_128851/g.412586 Transcript_128851/m.412586 type:complete len:236 (-) Transcript_128851:133-840(-)
MQGCVRNTVAPDAHRQRHSSGHSISPLEALDLLLGPPLSEPWPPASPPFASALRSLRFGPVCCGCGGRCDSLFVKLVSSLPLPFLPFPLPLSFPFPSSPLPSGALRLAASFMRKAAVALSCQLGSAAFSFFSPRLGDRDRVSVRSLGGPPSVTMILYPFSQWPKVKNRISERGLVKPTPFSSRCLFMKVPFVEPWSRATNTRPVSTRVIASEHCLRESEGCSTSMLAQLPSRPTL